MRTRWILLGLSVVANAALALLVLTAGEPKPRASESPTPTLAKTEDVAGQTTANRPSQVTWIWLSDGSPRDLAARLRAAGFPERIIWDLVATQVRKNFAERRRQLLGEEELSPYWRASVWETGGQTSRDPQVRAQLRALENEFMEQMRELMGNPASATSEYAQYLQRRTFGDLPPEKIRQIEAISKDYEDLRRAVREEMRDISFPEDEQQLALLDKEHRADLQALLTPEEFAEFDRRASDTANGLRNQLAAFDASEAEYRALFDVQRAFEERYRGQTLSADESREAREAMVAQVLSPERFADYQLKTAGGYRELSSFVESQKLPPSAAADLLKVQRDITRRANAVRNDSALTTEQRTQQLAALAFEAHETLTSSLGKDGFENYRQWTGRWLQNLPPPAPGSGTTKTP